MVRPGASVLGFHQPAPEHGEVPHHLLRLTVLLCTTPVVSDEEADVPIIIVSPGVRALNRLVFNIVYPLIL